MLDFIRKKVLYFLVMRSFKKHEKQIIFDCPIYGEHGSDIIAKYGIADISVIKEGLIKSPIYSRSFSIH